MILGDGSRASGSVTLDALFRRAGVRNADGIALADPPNRDRVTGGGPRTLTFAQADRAISAFAAGLRGLGLHTGTVVGLQLPNTVESVIALLGTLRAGMVAAPLPLLWRWHDMVEALGRAEAKAIVTAGRIGACAHAEMAMEVAAELFPIRQVCAFGATLPDGVVPLDGVFTSTVSEPPPQRTGDAASLLAAYTFDHGVEPSAHDHAHLLAAGATLLRETKAGYDTPILSTLPLASFAGLALTLVPWLITGGRLELHHGFDETAFTAQASALESGLAVLPGPALTPLAAKLGPSYTIVSLWRGPLGAAAEIAVANVVDVVATHETPLIAAARGDDGLPGARIVEAAKLVDPGVIAIGAYQFTQRALDAATAAVDPNAMIAALPDAALGQRLAGHAADPAGVAAMLAENGVNPLISGAFRGRVAKEL